MILTSLRTSQLSPAALDRYAQFLSEVDARAMPALVDFLDDACVIQVNDGLPTYGKTAVIASFEHYYGQFARVEHEVLNLYGADTAFAAEVLCHYVRAETGQTVTVPAVAIYERDASERFTSIRIYVASSTMFEAFTGAAR